MSWFGQGLSGHQQQGTRNLPLSTHPIPDEALDAPWRPVAAAWFCSRPGTKDQMFWGNHGRDAVLRWSIREAINRPVEAKSAHADAPAMAKCDTSGLCPRQCPL